jgi:hypothetical protein
VSLASESNNRLGMLVTLVGKIEGYMAADRKKGDKGGKGGGEGVGDDAEKIKGLAGSVSELVKAVENIDDVDAKRFADFMTIVGNSVEEFANKIQEEDVEKIKVVAAIGGSVKGFAIGMVAVALLAPLVALGSLVFALSVRMITAVIGDKSLTEGQNDTLKNIVSLGRGIALYALGMAAIALLSPLVALGTLVFILSVSAIILVMNSIRAMSVGRVNTLTAITRLGTSIALYALGMAAIALLAPLVALGTLVFIMSVSAIILVMNMINTLSKSKTNALTAITRLGTSIALYALGMAAIALLAPLVALGTLVFIMSIVAISFALKMIDGKKTNQAATSLKKLLLPITLLMGVLFLVGLGAETIAIGALVMGVAIVGIGLAVYVLGQFDKDIKKGASALDALAIPLILFSAALTILSRGVTDEPGALFAKLGAIAASIVGLGLAAYALGQPFIFPFVMLGAVALTALAVPLIAFSGALFVLSKVKFEPGQFDALGDNLKKITTAFVDAFADLSLSDMLAIAAGIALTAGMSYAVSNLAMGVAKMANLEVVEFEVKKGKIVPKSTRKLKQEDFTLAGQGVAAILGALAAPLTDFGQQAKEGEGLFGGGYMEAGVEAAQGIGGIISSLAKGVADMANLNVIEYKIAGSGKKAKLVPDKIRKLTPLDFLMAGVNTGLILTALQQPLVDFGKKAREGGGLFGDSDIEKAIEVATGVTAPLAAMVDIVKAMAGGSVEVKTFDPKTGKTKVTDVKSFVDYIPDAKKGLEELFHAFIDPIQAIGSYYKSNEDSINDGIDVIKDLGDDEIPQIISKMVNSVKNVATTLQSIDAQAVGTALQTLLTGLGTGLSAFTKPIEDLDADDIPEKLAPLIDQLIRLDGKKAQELFKFNTAFTMFAANLSFTVSTIERIPKVLSPFERFVDKFGVFSKHIGSFVKNWKEWQKDNDKYWTNFSVSVDKLSKVDATKLKETAKIVAEMAKEQLALEIQRPEQDKGLLEKAADFVDKKLFGSEEPAKAAAAPAAPAAPPIDINTLTQAFTRALSTAVIIVKPDQTAIFRTRT